MLESNSKNSISQGVLKANDFLTCREKLYDYVKITI